ncbi:hypothetical protein ACK8OR_05345 [Jannaschia sp. KMU-145]|uniref:hypothetical protein n=1 Tax=Jannaschia halovivens TaxID=3388667 RepID=UPI00396AFBC0
MSPTFTSAEDGAVTVDWVVLTAALVGLGLAVSSVVSRGVQDVSGDIDATLQGNDIIQTSFAAIFANVTEAMTATATHAAGDTFSDLRNETAFSFQMDATLSAGDSGILFEAGGTGTGTILYQHEGVLYLQGGRGNGFGEASDRGEALWTVEDGTYSIEGSLDASTGLALYINGEVVSQSSFSGTTLAGGNAGTVGDANTSAARNRGSFVQGDGHPGAGDLTLYVGQTTGDEVGG